LLKKAEAAELETLVKEFNKLNAIINDFNQKRCEKKEDIFAQERRSLVT
jgi:hypothetical protein